MLVSTMLLLVNKLRERKSESQDRRKFESVRALFVICTHVITLHSCYVRMLIMING